MISLSYIYIYIVKKNTNTHAHAHTLADHFLSSFFFCWVYYEKSFFILYYNNNNYYSLSLCACMCVIYFLHFVRFFWKQLEFYVCPNWLFSFRSLSSQSKICHAHTFLSTHLHRYKIKWICIIIFFFLYVSTVVAVDKSVLNTMDVVVVVFKSHFHAEWLIAIYMNKWLWSFQINMHTHARRKLFSFSYSKYKFTLTIWFGC